MDGMNLLVLGGTGPTGRLVVGLALEAGDRVTVLVRDPARLGDLARRVTVRTGDATSRRDVSAATAGQDAVISALGTGKSLIPHGLAARAAAAVIAAAGENGVSRLVWLSAFGVGETVAEASGSQKLMFRTLLRSVYADKEIADARIRSSGLDWTVVHPTRLTNGPARGTYRAGERLPMKGNPTISRADVAAFLHRAVHDGEWIRRPAVISD